ncbi:MULTISPECIES: BamA/TamA family outer membrane protein [unclassified Sphingomonas]|uniref:autotransporter assembly complex protein TamA n=1 Tax=unclassified Sphingomonas TaxID=196159 RepID=UPI00257BC67E|nr:MULTISPECIES: BamA/TamA family outer membrane protein [unclassified Sphingomonas]
MKRIWLAALAGTACVPGFAHAQISDPKPGQGAPPSGPAPAPSAAPAPAQDGTVRMPPVDESPIVPDAQFEAAMPKIEGDINAPLEAMPSPTGSPTPGPAPATQGQAVQQVREHAEESFAAAPAEDPEFARPLPPLSEFKVEPPVEDKVADKKSLTIRYTTHEEGLSAVGLAGLFEDLSALKNGGGRAANTAMVAARAREDERLAIRLLQSRGYYDATAISTVDQNPQTPGTVRATISATAGPLYRLGDVKVASDPTVPPGLLLDELNLNPGDPIEAERVQGAEANVALRLPQQGYPFVKVGQRDILLDGETHVGDYTLPIELGPRAVFGDIRTEVGGDSGARRGERASRSERRQERRRRVRQPAFDADHIRVLRRYKPGALYDIRAVDDLREAMIATSLFSTVSVEPVRTGQAGPDDTEVVDLLVRQNPGRPRTLAAELGYSTGQGIRLTGSWTHRNLFPPEGALIVAGVLGTQEQGLTTTFRRSNAGQRDKTFQIAAALNHQDYDAYESYTGTLSFRFSRDSTPIWQKRWTYFYGAELVGANEDRWNYNSNRRDRGTWLIAAAPLFLGYDSSDNLLNPTRGFRIKANASPETSVRGAARPYARFMLEGTYYQPVSDSIVIAGRARVGSIMGIARDDLPPSRRYYSGGGGSVRGFGYQELGPRSPDGKPVGGRSFNEFAIEARYRFGNYGIVPFIDAGQVYEGIYPTGKNIRFGAGIGGRLYTNFGPIRVDVATPINRKPGESKVSLYISIGQAF